MLTNPAARWKRLLNEKIAPNGAQQYWQLQRWLLSAVSFLSYQDVDFVGSNKNDTDKEETTEIDQSTDIVGAETALPLLNAPTGDGSSAELPRIADATSNNPDDNNIAMEERLPNMPAAHSSDSPGASDTPKLQPSDEIKFASIQSNPNSKWETAPIRQSYRALAN